MAFALFSQEDQYHLIRASHYKTFCGRRVKGRVQLQKERQPAAVVTKEEPSPRYTLCQQCHMVRGLNLLNKQTKQPSD
jgi:hypothetical protein